MTVYTTQNQISDQSSIVRGNVAIIGGIWSASSTIATATAVTTDGNGVLAAGITLVSSDFSTTAECPTIEYTKDQGVITINPSHDSDAGNWWAIVSVSHDTTSPGG